MLLIGVLIGWVASRLVIPVPTHVFVSPHIRCEGQYLVTVPFGINVRWAVQGGTTPTYWNMLNSTWSKTPWWHAGPGKTVVTESQTGIRLLAEGFGSTPNIAGVTVTSVRILQEAKAAAKDVKPKAKRRTR
jgi:hypothetical protein